MLFRSIVDRGNGRRRQNDPRLTFPLSSLLESYQCVRHDEHISYGNLGDAVPPFGLAFSSVKGLQSVLAVANEEGIVRIYNTESREKSVLKEWLAHENAVFDIAWVPGEPRLVTASGDQMARLWDVTSGELLGSCKGHLCSLKSVAFTQQEKAVFCTGGRDGNIMVWDTRCSKKDGFYRQVKQISGAHNKAERITPSKTKKRRPSVRGMAPTVDSQQSVTVVLFRDEQTIISSGAVDGVIKMWDLRKNYTVHHHDPVPLQAYPYPGSCTRKLGYSGLAVDSTGSNLMCNCTDDNIYMFNISGLKATPVGIFSGHLNSSFYVKSTISPDDQFLASGSSDHHTYIWKISDPKSPPVILQGHSQEVTSIAWCPTDFTKIASCSDDNTVRIWRLDRGMDGAKSSVGEANLVGWAKLKSPSRPVNGIESTPVKIQSLESLGGLASPQQDTSAPEDAAPSLPSSTTSPIHPQQAKATAVCQRTPTSIKRWFSPSRGGLHDQISPPRQRVLNPCPQSSVSSTPPSERRAKRRLETGGGALGGCEGAEQCDCVKELYPVAKRGRSLADVVCLAQDQHHCQAQKDSDRKDHVQTLLRETDKENCCPRATDWLSAMGQKMRMDWRNPGSPGSPRSPRSPRSLGASKKQECRAPNSPTIRSPQSMKKISSYFTKRPLE
ncbi:denticleless protein homolog [Genypterus blacodes]|uniref:denticleless protein homolog n=1 Tax=Genypterus blacodes TaxID=154954 RepID=UPI003F765EDA